MKVTVYSNPNCQPCKLTKMLLDKIGVDYENEFLADHPDIVNWALDMGYMSAPVVVAESGDTKMSWSGYSPANIKGLLG